MKTCPKCSQQKSLSEFVRNRSTKDGYGNYCKICHNAKGREFLKRNGGTRHYKLKARYGITEAEVQELIAKQGRMCAICSKPDPTHLDHDHATGKVRGVLCVPCNNGLGLFRDNPQLLLLAAAHLSK